DAHEPNDDAGEDAYRLYFPAGEKARFVKASLDFWDDQDDVYAVYLRPGEKLYASLVPSQDAKVALALWRPETVAVADLARQDLRVRLSNKPGRRERLAWKAGPTGWDFLHARLHAAPGSAGALPFSRRGLPRPCAPPVAYRLSIVRTR